MSRSKLERFAQNNENPLVIQAGKPNFHTIKYTWQTDFFEKEQPIVLELACGGGEYTLALAQIFPQKNFIGIDIKGSRFARNATFAYQNGLKNIGFLRTKIENLADFFLPQSISEIWITFPDPRPKLSDARKRLTSPRFWEIYRPLLKPNAILHLKTDNRLLFDYSLEMLREQGITDITHTYDLYQSPLLAEHFGVQTKYEKIFLEKGFTINYFRCVVPLIDTETKK